MNLVISPAGDKSVHKQWLVGKPNFELVLLYYGEDLNIAKSYTQDTSNVYASKGFKWWLIKSFIEDNLEWVSQFEYIWFPDDDIEIDTENINKLFDLAKQYSLWLCQPSLLGYATFDVNYSSWGLDGIWPYLLGHPKDKIAILDTIIMRHTKPPGNPELYSQIPHSIEYDTELAYEKYAPGMKFPHAEYTQIPLN